MAARHSPDPSPSAARPVRRLWLFDIDGTLIRTGGAGKAAMSAALVSRFGTAPHTGDVPFSGRTDRSIVRDLFRHHRVEETAENVRDFCAEYVRRLRGLLASHGGAVLPGARSWLEHLAGAEDTHVGLLTGNLRDGAAHKLMHYGLWDFFPFGGFGDHHLDRDGVAWEALEAACRHLGHEISGAAVCVVGDTPQDVRCARAIGARAVAVATGNYSLAELRVERPDVLLEDLRDWRELSAS
jgi:phosphoglycolate phosphatase-like HAD superfamily hydrolase